MKLALGTVQFGQNYGIANETGKVSLDEARAIIEFAADRGIDTLDTAIAYGDSEQRLGRIGVDRWRIVSKLPALPDSERDVGDWVANEFDASCVRLGLKRMYALLLHQPMQLLEDRGEGLYQALSALKQDGRVKKVGISIYSPDELEQLESKYRFDLVQAPFNIFDRRLKESGWLAKLHRQGIEVHVRSVFLQGLLLLSPLRRPREFRSWEALWKTLDDWITLAGITPLQACLSYPMSIPEISKVVVGVDSLAQLEEIVEVCDAVMPAPPESLASADPDLIDPSRWQRPIS